MNYFAILILIVAMACISAMDTLIKFFSGTYALHEIIFIRSMISLSILFPLLFLVRGESFKSNKWLLHSCRGLLLVIANMCFYVGLAGLPLAEASAIVFLAPVFITIFAHYFLRERLNLNKIFAVFLGLLGMILIVKPFGVTLEGSYIWPFLAALFYAGFITMTRYISSTESAALMAITSNLSFIFASGLIGISFGSGKFSGFQDAGFEFFFRAWAWPLPEHYLLLLLVGALSTAISISISVAYKRAKASTLAPFEYSIFPMVLLWGYVVFDEFPDFLSIVGMVLIALGGLVVCLGGLSKKQVFTRK